jgi:TRAP-type C4-dicarboxylate transport system permease small subunit
VPGAGAALAAPRWVAALDLLLKLTAGALVVVLLGTVMAGVVSRALNHPLSWTDEASGFLMVWLACLGWMIATRRGSHIRIRLIQERLPPAAWRGFEVGSQIAAAVIGGVVSWASIHLMRVNSDIEAVSLPVAVAWMYAPLLPAGLLTLVQALADMRKSKPEVAALDEAPPW